MILINAVVLPSNRSCEKWHDKLLNFMEWHDNGEKGWLRHFNAKI